MAREVGIWLRDKDRNRKVVKGLQVAGVGLIALRIAVPIIKSAGELAIEATPLLFGMYVGVPVTLQLPKIILSQAFGCNHSQRGLSSNEVEMVEKAREGDHRPSRQPLAW